MKIIIQSEFFWGIVVGLLLSFLGGWFQSKLTADWQRADRINMVVIFCIDVITNLQNIVKEMDSTRDRSKAIHHDFLELINVEITIYGRNREHLVLLPKITRNKVREHLNEFAIKRADIVNNLEKFYRGRVLSNKFRDEGRDPEADRELIEANNDLLNAQKSADKLVTVSARSTELLSELSKI